MLNSDGTKRCPKCGETKSAAGNFYKTGRGDGDGYTGYCIACTKAAATSWQKALPEDRRRAKNKQDWQRTKARFENDPEAKRRRAESVKRWINASPENKEKQRAWQLDYKKRDPERRRQQNQIRNNHARAIRLGRQSNFHWVDWLRVLEFFGHRCAFCGAENALLDMEHLVAVAHGDGHNVPGNVVPACRPCNAQKWRKTLEQFCDERRLDADELRKRAASAFNL